MSKNLSEIPYTEITERGAQIARLEGDDSRVRGAANDVYLREVIAKEDWAFLLLNTALACVDDYATGTVSINTQETAATFSSDVALNADFTGRKIKFGNNSNVYDLTFSNTTGGTILPPLSGTSNISSGSYSIFASIYALPEDFDRFPKNGGLLLFQGGKITQIPEVSPQEWYRDFTPTPGTPERCRLVRAGTDQLQRVEVNPPPSQPFVLGVEYLEKLDPLRETTAGFVTVNSNATTVTGSAGTTRFTEAQTGWYFRVDAFGTGEDSEWYRITAIANNSSLTLATAFGLTGGTTTRYTISAVPRIPAKLHGAILYGTVRQLLTDQNDPTYQFYQAKFTEAVADARRIYRSRQYNQEVTTIQEEYHFRR